jgi:hypothetical protein
MVALYATRAALILAGAFLPLSHPDYLATRFWIYDGTLGGVRQLRFGWVGTPNPSEV